MQRSIIDCLRGVYNKYSHANVDYINLHFVSCKNVQVGPNEVLVSNVIFLEEILVVRVHLSNIPSTYYTGDAKRYVVSRGMGVCNFIGNAERVSSITVLSTNRRR